MIELLQLFVTFFIIGLVSFGGGYAMIPLMQTEVVSRYHWLTLDQFTDVTAIAGISPGPIAVNMAVSIGYMHKQLPGAVAATLGIIGPAFLCMLVLAAFYKRMKNNRYWQGSMFGVRAAVTGFIVYSAIVFSKNNAVISPDLWYTLSQLTIFSGALIAIAYFKKHPVYVIAISGLIGIALYS